MNTRCLALRARATALLLLFGAREVRGQSALVQLDGEILIGGDFTLLTPKSRSGS